MDTSKDRPGQIEEALRGRLETDKRIDLLIELSTLLGRDDATRAAAHAREALEIAERVEDAERTAQSLLALGIALESLTGSAESIERFARARQIYRQLGLATGQANAHNSSGIAYKNQGAYSEALREFGRALELFIEGGEAVRIAAAHNNIGTVHDLIGNYDQALAAYLAALDIYEEQGLERNGAIVKGNIANIYYYLRDHELSLRHSREAIEVFERVNDRFGLAHMLGNISTLYKARGDYDEAQKVLERSRAIYEAAGEQRSAAIASVRIGSVLALQGKRSVALRVLTKGAATLRDIGALGDYSEAMLQIGRLHVQARRYDDAVTPLCEALAVAESAGLSAIVSNCHLELAASHKALGDFERALLHTELHAAISDELYSSERHRAVAAMQARSDIERAEREREYFRERASYMEQIADQRSKELSTNAAQLVRTNNLLQSIRLDLKKSLDATNPVRQKTIATVIESIESDLRSSEDWKRFEEMYQLVHHDFIRRISERHPDLSGTELKICALLNINLSNKEIADMLCISTRTVESHRYRIRRKIGLEGDTNLSAYMTSLGG